MGATRRKPLEDLSRGRELSPREKRAETKLTAQQRAQFGREHFERLAIINQPFPEARRRQSAMPWAGTIVRDDMLLKLEEKAKRIQMGGLGMALMGECTKFEAEFAAAVAMGEGDE